MAESNAPDLQIVLPDGTPIQDIEDEMETSMEEAMSPAMEFDVSPEGTLTTTVEIEIEQENDVFYKNLAEDMDEDLRDDMDGPLDREDMDGPLDREDSV